MCIVHWSKRERMGLLFFGLRLQFPWIIHSNAGIWTISFHVQGHDCLCLILLIIPALSVWQSWLHADMHIYMSPKWVFCHILIHSVNAFCLSSLLICCVNPVYIHNQSRDRDKVSFRGNHYRRSCKCTLVFCNKHLIRNALCVCFNFFFHTESVILNDLDVCQ